MDIPSFSDQASADSFWYKGERTPEERASLLFGWAGRVEDAQPYVRERNLLSATLYSNRPEPGLRFGDSSDFIRDPFESVTDNLIKTGVDTATSLQGTGKVKPTFLTRGADWDTFKLADDLDAIIWGFWNALHVNEKQVRKFKDSATFGTGCLRVMVADDELCIKRVLIDDIIVDEKAVDSTGMPRTLAQVTFVSREVLRAKFIRGVKSATKRAELETKLAEASHGFRQFSDWRGVQGQDMVMFLEAWHLPSSAKAGEGRYVAAISNYAFVDESYDDQFFPFVFTHYDEPTTGFYGVGVPELGLGHQIRMNEFNDFVRQCQNLCSAAMWMVPNGSNVHETSLTNDLIKIVYFDGVTQPTVYTPQAVNPEIYKERDHIEDSFMRRIGISQMSSQGVVQPQIEHAVAMRELTDAQTRRHLERTSRHEFSSIQLSRLILHYLRQMVLSGMDIEQFPESDRIKRVDWKKVDPWKPSFTMQIQVSSIMSETPAGREQRIAELLQYGGGPAGLGGGDPVRGWKEVMRLRQDPDLEAYYKRSSVSLERIEWLILQMRGTSTTEPVRREPEVFDDLPEAIPAVQNALREFEMRPGVPEEVLDNFRYYIERGQEILADMQQQAMAEQAAAAQAAQAPAPAPEP